eukprot:UN13938
MLDFTIVDKNGERKTLFGQYTVEFGLEKEGVGFARTSVKAVSALTIGTDKRKSEV